MKIAIVGAGVGGLSAAIFLRQAGFDVDVHEQAPELAAVGAGLRLSPNGLRLLRRAGLGPDLESEGVRPQVAWDLRRWSDGETIWRGQFDVADEGAGHLLIHRADLLDILLGHLEGPGPFLGRRLIRLIPGDVSAGVRARLEFADGTAAEADLVIGADGIHSLVCDRFMPSRPPVPSGHSAFRATVPTEKTAFSGAPAAAVVWMGPGKHFVAYPVSAGRLINIIGVVPASSGDEESWSADGDAEVLSVAFAGWDSAVRNMISHAPGLKRWALMHRAPLACWTSGSIAVLGDAAHPMLPHLAQGACQAVEDAACLASVLSGIAGPADAPAALRRYEELRRPRASRIQMMSQSQGESYHLADGPDQQARDARLAADGIPAQSWIYDHDATAAGRSLDESNPAPTGQGRSYMQTVAFLGLGKMGAAMAGNIAAAGFPLVVYNRTAATACLHAGRIGAGIASTPRQAVGSADIVITMLADHTALGAVYHGPDGILAGLRPGAVAVDMGTSGRDAILALAPEVAAVGALLVDAPVSGSTAAAEAGTLTILVGGDPAAIAKAQPVLDAVGSLTHHVGAAGAGAAMKLALNVIVHSTGQALAEALVLAEHSGITRRTAYEVFSRSAVASPVLGFRRDKFLDPEGAPTTFQVSLARKDLLLAWALAQAVGVPLPQVEAAMSVLQSVADSGRGEDDVTAVAAYLRECARQSPASGNA